MSVLTTAAAPSIDLDHWQIWATLIAARTDELRVAAVASTNGEATNRYRKAAWPRWQPHLPYAVYLGAGGRYYTLALDLDGKPGRDPSADSDRLGELLAAAGIRYIETVSGPAGGRHLIARFPAGLDAARVAAVARALRATIAPSLDVTPLLNVRTGALRPPLAPHRHGGTSTLLTPSAQAHRILSDGNVQDSFHRLCQLLDVRTAPSLDDQQLDAALRALPHRDNLPHLPGEARPLPARTQLLLAAGDTDGDYPDRSALAAAICLSHVNARRPFTEFLHAARDSRQPGLEHLRLAHRGHGRYQRRNDRDTVLAARRMWTSAVRFALTHPAITDERGDVEDQLSRVAAAAANNPRRWSGQGGPSELATLQAVLAHGMRCVSTAIGIDVRRLALATGLTRSSSARALHRLHNDGWLELLQPATGTLAAVYQPVTPPHLAARDPLPHDAVLPPLPRTGGTLVLAPHPLWSLPPTLATKAHDTFTYTGLGRYAAHLLTCLQRSSSPADVTWLAKRTGLARRTCQRNLRRLTDAGLAHGNPATGYTAIEADLDACAARLGTRHTVARRKETYTAERTLYRWYQADYTARAGWAEQRGLYRAGRAQLPLPGVPLQPAVQYPRLQGRASWYLAERLLAQSGDVDLFHPPV